jgi:hypothetical protein
VLVIGEPEPGKLKHQQAHVRTKGFARVQETLSQRVQH